MLSLYYNDYSRIHDSINHCLNSIVLNRHIRCAFSVKETKKKLNQK